MLDLSIRFKTLPNLAVFLILSLASSFWIYQSLKKNSRFSLLPFVLLNVLIFTAWGIFIGIDHDEGEHLHCAWMVAQGLIPYKDFWQHHPPLLWVAIAPILKIMKPTALVFAMSRIFSAFIFTAISFMGWQVVKRVWQKEARPYMYSLILLGASVLGEFLWIRPDLFMTLFLLAGLYLCLEIPDGKTSAVFFSGIAFALAGSFMFKQFLLLLLPIMAILLERKKSCVYKLLVYSVGLAIGSFPLMLYLSKNHIQREFIFWTFRLNAEKTRDSVTFLSATFPVAVGLAGVWGVYLLLKRYHKFKDSKALILAVAFCLSTLNSFTGTIGRYYLGFWSVLCAILIGGYDIQPIISKKGPLLKNSIFAGLFLAVLTFSNFYHGKTHIKTYFSGDNKEISRLIKHCANDTCLLILPLHPVFSYDATRLYTDWQYASVNKFPEIKKDAKNKNIAEEIINLRPAVVMHAYKKKLFILDLLQKDLISADDCKRLIILFKNDYTLVQIGRESYYIRKDKL